jgi:hypothetical protein
LSVFFIDKKYLWGIYKLMAPRGRPHKPKTERREKQLHIRLTDTEHGVLDVAARDESLDTATWARTVLLKAASAKHGKMS